MLGLRDRNQTAVERWDGSISDNLLAAGSRGLGEAMSRLFADEGAQVVFCDVLDELAQAVASSITQTGASACTGTLMSVRSQGGQRWFQRLKRYAARSTSWSTTVPPSVAARSSITQWRPGTGLLP